MVFRNHPKVWDLEHTFFDPIKDQTPIGSDPIWDQKKRAPNLTPLGDYLRNTMKTSYVSPFLMFLTVLFFRFDHLLKIGFWYFLNTCGYSLSKTHNFEAYNKKKAKVYGSGASEK